MRIRKDEKRNVQRLRTSKKGKNGGVYANDGISPNESLSIDVDDVD